MKGGKSVRFTTYDSAYDESDKAVQFICLFEIAFHTGIYREKSKLKIVSLRLMIITSAWWGSLLVSGAAPTNWKDFKR